MILYTSHACVFPSALPFWLDQGTVVSVLGSLGIPGGKDPDEAIHEAIQGGGQDELLGGPHIYAELYVDIMYVYIYIFYILYILYIVYLLLYMCTDIYMYSIYLYICKYVYVYIYSMPVSVSFHIYLAIYLVSIIYNNYLYIHIYTLVIIKK